MRNVCLFLLCKNPRFKEVLERIFCRLLVVEAFSLQKIVKMLEEEVVGCWEVRLIWLMRQNFIAQLIQLLKHWLWDVQLGIVLKKNWALSVDQCWLQVLQFSVHLIDFLSILLRWNGFPGIQKAVVDQMGRRPPKSNHDLFLVHVWLWEVLWSCLSVQPQSWSIASCCIKSTFYRMSQSDQEMVHCCCTE